MALDFSKIQEKKKELEATLARSGSSGDKNRLWRAKDGENLIRILPPWTAEGMFKDQFWREMAQHWGLNEGKGPVMCPAKTPDLSGECPVCEFVEEIKKDKSNPEAQELVKQIRAKVTYLLNVIDIEDPIYTARDIAEWKKSRPDSETPFKVGQTKIQHYACPSTIFDQVLGLINKNKADITDSATGRNLTVTKFPNKDPRLTRYQVTPSFEQTAAPMKADDKLPALNTFGYVADYASMAGMLASGPAGTLAAQLPPSTALSPPEGDDAGEDLAAQMRKHLGS